MRAYRLVEQSGGICRSSTRFPGIDRAVALTCTPVVIVREIWIGTMGAHQYRNADLDFLPSFAAMVGPRPPDEFISNGATGAPDIVWGHDLRPAAHFHDYWYSAECVDLRLPRDEQTRYEADQLFRENLKRCGLGRLRFAYYYRVRFWGHLCFTYDPGHEPRRTVWFWLRLLIGRYISW